jgi:hypothetical protein
MPSSYDDLASFARQGLEELQNAALSTGPAVEAPEAPMGPEPIEVPQSPTMPEIEYER